MIELKNNQNKTLIKFKYRSGYITKTGKGFIQIKDLWISDIINGEGVYTDNIETEFIYIERESRFVKFPLYKVSDNVDELYSYLGKLVSYLQESIIRYDSIVGKLTVLPKIENNKNKLIK